MTPTDADVKFPLVIYEDGKPSEVFYDLPNLMTNLENFDSDSTPEAPILDAENRQVRLIIHFMEIKVLELYPLPEKGATVD